MATKSNKPGKKTANKTAKRTLAKKAVKKASSKSPAKKTAKKSSPKKAVAKKPAAKKSVKSPAKKAAVKSSPKKGIAKASATTQRSTKTESSSKSSGIAGKTFLFTGTLTGMQRKEAEALVKANGGTILSGVSDKLNYLVVGEDAGSKLDKAKKIKSIKVLSEKEFENMISTSKGSTTNNGNTSHKKLYMVYYEISSEYDDESENITKEVSAEIEAKSINQLRKLIENEIESFDWDDSDVINYSAKSDLICTNKDFIRAVDYKGEIVLDEL